MREYTLGDIAFERSESCKTAKEYSHIVGLEHLIPEQVELTEWSDPTEDNTFTKMFREGDVLFGRRRAYLKKASVAPFDGICSGDITVIVAKPDIICPSLLPFVIQNDRLFEYAVKMSAGGLSPRVKWKDLKLFPLLLPEMPKQETLADLLWSMEYTKRAYRKMIEATDELVKSQFIEMFGDPVKNPKMWPKKQLQELVTDDCTISYGIVQTGDDQEEGVPVFRPVDVVGGTPTLESLKKTTKEISDKYKRTLLRGRELLITVRANIADTCIIGEVFRGCNVGRGIVPIRTQEDIMPLEFLKGQMDFESMNQYLKSLAKGVTLIQLNLDDLRKVELIVPPLELQKTYMRFLKQSDKSKFAVSNRNLSRCSVIQKRTL